ncbi:MAG TPA: FAD-dependent oxidoreductase, partial [Pseudonocardiaceae bacterium]
SYDAERRPFAEQVVIASLHNAKTRLMPTLDLRDTPDPLDVLALGFGFRCRSNAVIATDDDQDLAEDPTKPSGRPGFRAPHVPVVRAGAEVSTVDLFGTHWVLIAADDAWRTAAEHAAGVLGIGLTSYRIGDDLVDPTGSLAERYGIGDAGASLIRPDGIVAWRSTVADTEPTATLVTALARLLDRSDVTTSA